MSELKGAAAARAPLAARLKMGEMHSHPVLFRFSEAVSDKQSRDINPFSLCTLPPDFPGHKLTGKVHSRSNKLTLVSFAD